MVAATPVLISRCTGRAVVGFLRPKIVLPEWVLARDEETRRVVVEHEGEHIRARDPYLLLVAIAAVVAMPWNVAVWWQIRRLRLAIEVDCDARVLRRQPDIQRYGMLLLEVGQFAAGGHPALAAFSEPRSFLERRIRVMTRSKSRYPVLRLTALLAVSGLMIFTACEAPRPVAPTDVASGQQRSDDREAIDAPSISAEDTAFPSITSETRWEIASLLQREYPPLLRDAGVEGTVVLDFVVDEQGVPRNIQVAKATHQAFGDAAVRVMEQARFSPARVGTRAVARRLQLPIAFKLESRTPADAGARSRATSVRSAIGDTIPPAITDEFRRQLARTLEREYPPLLRDAGVEGQAIIDFTVDEQGIPRDVKVERATHEAFGKAGVAVMREARFNPARVGSTAVAKRIQIPIGFKLSSRPAPDAEAASAGDGSRKRTPLPMAQSAIRRFYPSIQSNRLAADALLWFIVNDQGEVIKTGKSKIVDERGGVTIGVHGSGLAHMDSGPESRTLKEAMQEITDSKLAELTHLFKGSSVAARSQPAFVLWIQLKEGARLSS
jgi:TonB family protein